MEPLLLALHDPQALPGLALPQWEALVSQARRTNLLSRVAAALDTDNLLREVPAAPRAHLLGARALAQAQAAAVRREVAAIDHALSETGVPIVLLKGAAYLLAGLPAARGRLFSDIDVLVPRAALTQVENALMLAGWAAMKTTPYDQRYYRRWMHELPPLKHVARQTVLDVHHAILPLTARLKPDSARLLAASRSLPGEPRLRVLAPVDMVLHSATHLFCNEDVGNSLRDLVDLDGLLRSLTDQDDGWPRLTVRAAELDLTRPLYYALRYAAQILDTPIPVGVRRAAELGRPPPWLGTLMDALFLRALCPGGTMHGLASFARGLLYVRAHWLRMPPLLLARHLLTKAFHREAKGRQAERQATG